MKRLFSFLKLGYMLGFKWSRAENYDEELITQVYYIQAIIVGLAIASKVASDKFGLYLIFILVHLVSMYVFGFLKSLWEGDKKEKIFCNIYRAINIVLGILSLFILKSVEYIFIIVIATGIGIVSPVIFYEVVEEICDSKNIKKEIAMTISDALACVFAIAGIFITGVPIIWKMVLSLIYIFCIPIITIAADNGMNFLEVVSYDTVLVDVDEEFLKQINNKKDK